MSQSTRMRICSAVSFIWRHVGSVTTCSLPDVLITFKISHDMAEITAIYI